MTGVGEESDGCSSKEVPIEPSVLNFDPRYLSIGIYVFREFSKEHDSGVDEGEDGDDADVAEAGHVSDQGEREEDEEGCGATLHRTVLPGRVELEVVLGADSAFLKETCY